MCFVTHKNGIHLQALEYLLAVVAGPGSARGVGFPVGMYTPTLWVYETTHRLTGCAL